MTRALLLLFLALHASLAAVAGSEPAREPWLLVERGLDVRGSSPFLRVASGEQGATIEVVVPAGARLVVDRLLLLRNIGEARLLARVELAMESEADENVSLRLFGPPGSASPDGTCCAIALAPGAQMDVGLEAIAAEGAVEGTSSAFIWSFAAAAGT